MRVAMHEDDDQIGCPGWWSQVSDYADGACSAAQSLAVEAHLRECASCAADLEFVRATSVALRDVPLAAPPAGLRDAILAATVRRPTLGQRVRSVVFGTRGPAAALGFAAAACALVAIWPRTHNPGREFAAIPRGVAPAAVLDVQPPDGAAGSVLPAASHPAVRPALRVHAAPDVRERDADGSAVRVRPANAGSGAHPRAAPAPAAGGMAVASSATLSADAQPVATAAADPVAAPSPLSEGQPTPSEPETPVAASARSSDEPARTTLAATGGAAPGQMAALADVRRSLRLQAADGAREIALAVQPRRQIRVDVIHSTF